VKVGVGKRKGVSLFLRRRKEEKKKQKDFTTNSVARRKF
jgi:hypothetical protein